MSLLSLLSGIPAVQSETPPPDFMMPMPERAAALQFFTESMRSNTATLQQVNSTLQGVQEEQREMIKLMQDQRERLVKLESNKHDKAIEDLKEILKNTIDKFDDRIETLERAQIIADTHQSTASWFVRHSPQLFALIAGTAMIAILLLDKMGKL